MSTAPREDQNPPLARVERAPSTTTRSEEDPRARAKKRAEELLKNMGDDDGDGTNKFYIDPRWIPDGWSYEYKRITLLGKEDPSYEVNLARGGWEAVPAKRHPNLVPVGFKGDSIIVDGMLLMERPLEITERVKARDLARARQQVREKEQQLGAAPAGTFERDRHANTRPSVKKSFEHVPIPEE